MERTPFIDWPVPASFPVLAPAQVHVWCAWLDDPRVAGPEAGAALSAAELARAAAFHFDTDRRRYVAAHGMLRGLLARYLGIETAAVSFIKGSSGKPALAGTSGLRFNLSHSGPLALLAVARDQQVGVDIEYRMEITDIRLLEERMFTPPIRRRQQVLTPEARLRTFYRRWTQLEATGKCRGIGLDLENLVEGNEHLASADPVEGFTGCVACEREPEKMDFFQFSPQVLTSFDETTAQPRPILPGSPHRHPTFSHLSSA